MSHIRIMQSDTNCIPSLGAGKGGGTFIEK